MSINNTQTIDWYVNSSFAIHKIMRITLELLQLWETEQSFQMLSSKHFIQNSLTKVK
jgi:hypothetical protein